MAGQWVEEKGGTAGEPPRPSGSLGRDRGRALHGIVLFFRVVIDASAAADPAAVADALTGRIPTLGLRDHAVAKNFHLEAVILQEVD